MVVLTLEYKEHDIGHENVSLIVVCIAQSERTTNI